jgi:hypothetical protein
MQAETSLAKWAVVAVVAVDAVVASASLVGRFAAFNAVFKFTHGSLL